MDSSDRAIAYAQFMKKRRADVRLAASLAADAEIRRHELLWKAEFEEQSLDRQPAVFDVTTWAANIQKLIDVGS